MNNGGRSEMNEHERLINENIDRQIEFQQIRELNKHLERQEHENTLNMIKQAYRDAYLNTDKDTLIKLKENPFYNERDMTAPRESKNLQALVSPEIKKDFMTFAKQYNREHHVKPRKNSKFNVSTPLKHIIETFLNNNAITRKNYDLHVIIALNLNDHDPAGVQHSFIGYMEGTPEFAGGKLFNMPPKKWNTSQTHFKLEHFNRKTWNMLNIAGSDHELLFDINPSLYDDFETVKSELTRLHDIDFEHAYIVMFPLNNYLDIIHDGVYVSERSIYSHDGFVTLYNPDDMLMLDGIIARFTWSYYHGGFEFDMNVEHHGDFFDKVKEYAPEFVVKEYWRGSSKAVTPRGKLEIEIKKVQARLDSYESKVIADRELLDKLTEQYNSM